jgi:putative salt-induced outer membrane protein YdiY
MIIKYLKALIPFILLLLPCLVVAETGDEVKAIADKEVKASHNLEIDLTANEFKWDIKAGMMLSTGNTESFSFSGANNLLYRVKRFEHKLDLGGYFYRVSQSTSGVTGTFSQYVYGTYRLDYYILPKTTLYIGGGAYTDEITGINWASLAFSGVAHYFIYKEKTKFRVSTGYLHSYEDRENPTTDEQVHSASLGMSFEHKFNDRVTYTELFELEENVRHGNDFRMHGLSQLKVSMTKRLALALGFDWRFDNRPVTGFDKWDTITDVSFILSF